MYDIFEQFNVFDFGSTFVPRVSPLQELGSHLYVSARLTVLISGNLEVK